MKNTATIMFKINENEVQVDLEIPLNITANELVTALNDAYNLQIDVTDIKQCYLKAENPIALLKGNKTLLEFGVRNGTIIYFTK